tara:strand:- start:24 stop:230 length:207 start_codon:yes stop_codon:yes gene_type:complete
LLIYKLFSEKDYKKFLDESSFEGSASDSEDGFIHFQQDLRSGQQFINILTMKEIYIYLPLILILQIQI